MNTLTFTLLLGLALGQLVFLFQKTDFIVEYATRFGVRNRVLADQYETWKTVNEVGYGYPVFIRETFNTFWSRMFGCPFCLITFLSCLLSVFSWSWGFPLVAFASSGIASLFYLSMNLIYQNIRW